MPGDEISDRPRLDPTMAEIARDSGATLHAYPRPGRTVRGVILQDSSDDRGTRFAAAQLEEGGTLRITGHDTGPRVSEFFGSAITSYEWVYVVPPDRVSSLQAILSEEAEGGLFAALKAYHEQHGGRLHDLLTRPDVAAAFSNWHG